MDLSFHSIKASAVEPIMRVVSKKYLPDKLETFKTLQNLFSSENLIGNFQNVWNFFKLLGNIWFVLELSYFLEISSNSRKFIELMSCVMRHMSHITFFLGQSGEAYRWRVCYQRSLPRLVSYSAAL